MSKSQFQMVIWVFELWICLEIGNLDFEIGNRVQNEILGCFVNLKCLLR